MSYKLKKIRTYNYNNLEALVIYMSKNPTISQIHEINLMIGNVLTKIHETYKFKAAKFSLEIFGNYFTDDHLLLNKDNIYYGSQFAFEFAMILCIRADPKIFGNIKFIGDFLLTDDELIRIFISQLSDIISIANLYKLPLLYKYIDDIFKLYHHDIIKLSEINEIRTKLHPRKFSKHTIIYTLRDVSIKRMLSKFKEFIDDPTYNEETEYNNLLNVARNFTPNTNCLIDTLFKNCDGNPRNSKFSGHHDIFELLSNIELCNDFKIDDEDVSPIDIYKFINSVHNGDKINITSKFLSSVGSFSCIYDLKYIKSSARSYEAWSKLDVPAETQGIINLNCVILSTSFQFNDINGIYIDLDDE